MMNSGQPAGKLTAADILRFCDDWCDASISPDGTMTVGDTTERFRLSANGVIIPELDHEGLCAAVVGLSKVLLRPRLNAIIHPEHFELWSWCGQLLLRARSPLFPQDQYELQSLYETAIHAALARGGKPIASREEWDAQRRIEHLQPHHAQYLLQRSGLILAHLAFPLLETVLKRACASFVSFDGSVRVAFAVSDKQGKPKGYSPQDRKNCNSLRDLLVLHSTKVAPSRLVALIDRFGHHLAELDSSQHPFDLIYDWRNQSLHGETNIQTIGGTILSLSLLISLFEIENDFEQRRLGAIENWRFWASTSSGRGPSSFYPPY